MAWGFSSLVMSRARSPMMSRASWRSSGRCTKESATHSTPSVRAKSRSRRSFSVSTGMGRMASGTFTPFRSERGPPVMTLVLIWVAVLLTTCSRNLPSSSNKDCPGSTAAKSSGCGRQMRSAEPGDGSLSRVKSLPVSIRTLPPLMTPTRSFGPCKSARMAIGRPTRRSTSRTMS